MAREKETRTANGDGSIYYSETKKKWIAEVQWTDSSGKRQRKSFSGKKKVIVKSRLDEFRRQLLISAESLDKADVTFEEFCTEWMENKQINSLKPSSYDRKLCSLTNQVYPHIGGIPINKLTNDDIQRMVNNLRDSGLAYSTIKKSVDAVSSCMREYRAKTKTGYNPCEGIALPENIKKKQSDIKFFNSEERKKIKDVADLKYSNGEYVYRLGQIIIVLMYTGMRVGELTALTWDDIDFENKTIAITKNTVLVRDRSKDAATRFKTIIQPTTKTWMQRIIPISDMAMTALLEIQKITGDQSFVVATESGKQVSLRNIQRMFAKMLARAGVEHPCKTEHSDSSETSSAGVHILRHTFASMLFQNGCSVKIVSELLGHSDTKTTENTYIHLIQEQKVKAIENLDQYID